MNCSRSNQAEVESAKGSRKGVHGLSPGKDRNAISRQRHEYYALTWPRGVGCGNHP